MAITKQPAALFTHAYFVPEGSPIVGPPADVAGIDKKPSGDDPIWTSGALGDIEEFTPAPESELYEIMGGRPGGLVVTNIVELSRKLKLTFSVNEISPLVYRHIFGTHPLTSGSTQANPLESTIGQKGWLKFQPYAENLRRLTGDVWCYLKVTSVDPWSGKNVLRAKFEATVIWSSLQTLSFEA